MLSPNTACSGVLGVRTPALDFWGWGGHSSAITDGIKVGDRHFSWCVAWLCVLGVQARGAGQLGTAEDLCHIPWETMSLVTGQGTHCHQSCLHKQEALGHWGWF